MDNPRRPNILRGLFTSSIRNKIVLPYALLTLLIAVVGTYIVTTLVADSFEERFVSQLIDAGSIVSDEIVSREELRLGVGRNIVGTTGLGNAFINQNWQEFEDIVSPLVSTNDEIDSVVILDMQGQEVMRFQRPLGGEKIDITRLTGRDFSDWDSVQTILDDNTGLIKTVELAKDPTNGEYLFYTVSPIRTDNQGMLGVLLVGTYIREDLEWIEGLAAADVIVFDGSSHVIEATMPLTTDDQRTLAELLTPELYKNIISSKDITNIKSFDDTTSLQRYRLAYAPLYLQGRLYGVFAVALPSNFITDANARNRNTFGIVFTGGMVFVLLVGLLTSRQIIKPVLLLVQTTQAIARGDLERRTNITSEDEVGLLAINFDLMTDELHKKTIQLEEEASKLTAILASIADGVIVQDTKGNIIRKNPAADAIIQAMPAHVAQSTDEEDDISADPLLVLLTKLSSIEFHEKQRLEIGQIVLSALSAPVNTSDGEELGVVVILRDITQEVIAEKLKDKFIQSVSHELKTPMFPLTGSISLIKMMLPMIAAQVPPKIFEKLTHNTNVADEQANDIKNVVMAMVDLSEIDGDSFAINRTPMNIAEVCEMVANDWVGPMEEKGLDFEVLVPDEAVWINGDEEKLRQVLRTLLKNAYNYTLEGEVKLIVQQQNGRAEIAVKDTGVGILEKDQPELFSRFYRAIHDKKTFELSGIGLGLYLSKVIIERQEGEIWMESKPYGGSTFTFSFSSIPAPEPGDDDWDDWDDDWNEEEMAYEDGSNILM